MSSKRHLWGDGSYRRNVFGKLMDSPEEVGIVGFADYPENNEKQVLASQQRNENTPVPDGWQNLLDDWNAQIVSFQQRNYVEAQHLEIKRQILGVVATLLLTITGTTLFATLSSNPGFQPRLVAAILSFISAVGTALQTFLNYGGRSEGHRAVSSRCGSVVRKIGILRIYRPESPGKQREELESLSATIGDISKGALVLRASPSIGPLPPAPGLKTNTPTSVRIVIEPPVGEPESDVARDVIEPIVGIPAASDSQNFGSAKQ
jgi:hypothetical protein